MEKRNPWFTAASLVLVVSGLVFAISSIKMFDYIRGKLLDLTPGEILYTEWMKPPPVMDFDVYFFNWTNPHEFGDRSRKPRFTEVGPFRFDVRVERRNVTYHRESDTISYDLRRWYRFNRGESAHDLDFRVTILNQLSTAAAYKAKEMNYIFKKSTSFSISSLSSIEMTRTVGQLLFDGSEETMLSLFSRLPIGDTKIPDKFGFFYGKNGSSDGFFEIGTGRGSHKLGALYTWNNQKDTSYYGESCRDLVESSVDFYTDNIQENKLDIFNPELCRRFTLEYAKKSKVHGIEGLRFEVDKAVLDNGTFVPGNDCFCADQCDKYGFFPATLCKGHVNNYLSLPHMLKGDKYYTEKIEGMRPNLKDHNYHVVVEPTTGFLLRMKARLQMNILIEPTPDISMFENAPKIMFPVVWFENSVKIPEDGAFTLGILLSLKGVFVTIGLILIIFGILIYMLFVFELRRSEPKKYSYDEDCNSLTKEMRPISSVVKIRMREK